MAAIGPGWATAAWIEASWVSSAWAAVEKVAGDYSVLGPGAYPRPPYASFAGKSVAGAGSPPTLGLTGVGV